MRIEDFLIASAIFVIGVGVPTFLSYKFKTSIGFNAVWFSLIMIWMIPGFSFLSVTAYCISFLFFSLAGANHKKEIDLKSSMTPDEIEEYDRLKLEEAEAYFTEQDQNKMEKDTIQCPKCGSSKIQFLGNDRKSFSVGKAVGGGLLTGGIGTLAGFTGKKGKKDRWLCSECGYRFEK